MPERLFGVRVAATPAALDACAWPADALVLRIAPDEVLAFGAAPEAVSLEDPHAIVTAEAGYAGVWLSTERADGFLAAECDWALPSRRPVFAQGMVAGLPAKLWATEEAMLVVVPAVLAHELAERLP